MQNRQVQCNQIRLQHVFYRK